jgi:plasmid stabilization system protein ParE
MSPPAAKRAIEAIRAGLQTLEIAPEAGRPLRWLPEGYREWFIPFGNSGYVVLYRFHEGKVVVQALRHGKEEDYPG